MPTLNTNIAYLVTKNKLSVKEKWIIEELPLLNHLLEFVVADLLGDLFRDDLRLQGHQRLANFPEEMGEIITRDPVMLGGGGQSIKILTFRFNFCPKNLQKLNTVVFSW